MQPKNWITPRQYAILSRQSLNVILGRLEKGEIRGVKVNSKWRIYPDELQRTLGVIHPLTLKD